ncbi:MAG: hypothetical protein HYY16_14490 [Planctomycetes bacterium]|nr:hypothetical protein [Planctomycetota bacterium]
MWRCASCGEQNESPATVCRKCQGPLKTIDPEADPEETQLDIIFDPERPQPISERGDVQCPTCGQHFQVQTHREESSWIRRRVDHAMCPYCGHTVTPELLVRVAPAKRETAQVREVIYACPYCGKVLTIHVE